MKRGFGAFLLGGIVLAKLSTGVWAAASDPDLDALQSTRSRPLFVKSRRAPETASPEPDQAVVAASPASRAPDFVITGVVTGDGKKIVIVVQPGDQKSVSLGIGDQIGDWRVMDIRPRSIVVERGTKNLELELPSPAKLKSKGESNSND